MGSETYTMDGTAPAHYQVSAAATMQDPTKPAYYGQPISCDIKPRLTKEQHDILEAEFQKQSKPNTNTKKSFADALNVSLDKVNNWFQNRRAKSKQDAKKQAGTYGIYAQQPVNGLVNYDSDTSPSFTPSDYFSMMQQCARDDQLSSGLALGQMHHFPDQTMPPGLPYGRHPNPAAIPPHVAQDMFDSSLEMNRRTLTQEEFDAFGHTGDMTPSSGHYGTMYNGYPADQELFQQVFSEMHHDHHKPQDAFAFAPPTGAPLSSNDSSVASTISDHSVFDPSTGMHDHASMSASTSDYTDSRSSSCSGTQNVESYYGQVQVPHSQMLNHSSHWQPGQSVPVDPSALHQHFREVEQRQMMQPQPLQHNEQPLAWPADEAYGHSDAQNGNMLAQQMSNFAIQTPQPPQSATVETPAPPTSIALRRQRPRPAQLGLASLRSQSYNSTPAPHSPGHLQQTLSPGQTLRRIRSSNVINGVANGRVMKSVSGTAQRSPLAFTFADTVNSPKAVRHASTSSMGNLAPPTPLSPHDVQSQDQQQQATARSSLQSWQSSTNQLSRQVSISETDAEHDLSFLPGSALSQQNFTSPPQTPMFHQHPQQQQQQQQQFLHGSLSSNVMVENTPPQSAPAAQQTFPSSIFMAPPQYPQAAVQSHSQSQGQQATPMQAMVPSQPHQFMSASVPEQAQYHPTAVSFAPSSQYVVPSTTATCASPEAARFSFANGVPVVNAHGQLVMAFPPPQMAQVPATAAAAAAPTPMQFVQHATPPKSCLPQDTPPQTHYNFITTDGISPAGPAQHMSKPHAPPPAELFVHEYSPPQEVKNTVTPRKAVDSGPKNYTFANQGPEHFERTKKGVDSKAGSIASSSPASSATS